VILLHGFPETSMMWEPLIDALAQSGVVALDAGHWLMQKATDAVVANVMEHVQSHGNPGSDSE
jgi:hypothetical protein